MAARKRRSGLSPVQAAFDVGDPVRIIRVAWVISGSWELEDICFCLEEMARSLWGEEWDEKLCETGLCTTRDVLTYLQIAKHYKGL